MVLTQADKLTTVLAIGANTLTVNGTGSGATDSVSIAADNAITIAGGAINAAGVSLLGSLSGSGTLNITGNISGGGTLQASGGTLDVFGTVASGVALLMIPRPARS